MLTTAREIITLWVSRMVMFNRYFLDGQLPFGDVFIHAMIQDGHGQKMSKSLGNGVDPRDIIHGHGADAMRFTLVQMTTDTQDVRMPVDLICPHSGEAFTPAFVTTTSGHVVAAPVQTSPSDPGKRMVSAYGVAAGIVEPTDDMPLARNTSSKFDVGRNFANKLWNATRFALHRVDPATALDRPVSVDRRPFADRWITAKLARTVDRLESALAGYQFNAYADALYDFVWHDVCDRYLEMVKPTIDDDPAQQAVLVSILDAVLRIMHPVCPFVTEALWPHVDAARCGDVDGISLPPSDLLAGAAWPSIEGRLHDGDTIAVFERADDLIGRIRAVRGSQSLSPKQRIIVHVPAATRDLISAVDGVIEVLAGIGEVCDIDIERPPVASPITFEGAEILLSGLIDAVDLDLERARLQKVIEAKIEADRRLSRPPLERRLPRQRGTRSCRRHPRDARRRRGRSRGRRVGPRQPRVSVGRPCRSVAALDARTTRPVVSPAMRSLLGRVAALTLAVGSLSFGSRVDRPGRRYHDHHVDDLVHHSDDLDHHVDDQHHRADTRHRTGARDRVAAGERHPDPWHAGSDHADRATPSPAHDAAAGVGAPRRLRSGSPGRVLQVQTARVWTVEADGVVSKTHLVSGRLTWNQPLPGTYSVFSRSSHTCNIKNPNICWRFMVRFAKGPGGDNIGLHEIPTNTRTGAKVQSESQLGTALSGGCVRQATSDAIYMWGWAPVGTKVVVLP